MQPRTLEYLWVVDILEKRNMMEKDKSENFRITIVTVCYNAEKSIAKTMESVLDQTYGNIEYIIKDGESADRTNEIIEGYRERFKQRGVSFVHIVRKDNGIYDAMNQATDIATGEYINYMNADDIFFDGNVLTKIFKDRQTADLLYGDAVREYELPGGRIGYTVWKGQHHNFEEMPISHQACFFKTVLIQKYHYNCRYKIAADFHIVARFFVDKRTFCNIRNIVSVCTMDGLSNMQMKASYLEAIQVKKEFGMEESVLHGTFFGVWMVGLKQWILDVLPHEIVNRLMQFQLKRKGNKIYDNVEQIRNKQDGEF